MTNKVKDLTFGTDSRGDHALFIEVRHFDGWEVDEETKSIVGNGPIFFRIIENGEQKHSHGWIDNGKVCQWG